MPIIKMERKAADNEYLHKDFHISGDIGIAYIGNMYGDAAVKDYIAQYAAAYYPPLIEKIKEEGLKALQEYFINIFGIEKYSAFIKTELSENGLTVEIERCPAVEYMKSQNHTPSKWYRETTLTLYKVLAELAGYVFVPGYYEESNGKAKFSFVKKNVKNIKKGAVK